MIKAKQLYIATLIIYPIMALVGSKFLHIHWIHLLNTLLLCAIFHHLLEWKYDHQEDNKEEVG